MDLFHRTSEGADTRTGRDCQFCHHSDPDFSKRKPMDRLVVSKLEDSAGAHLTEDGHVKHRLEELMNIRARLSVSVFAKSA
jgi:hypothetical protein